MNGRPARSICVVVGTDHHPFTRLIAWADAWASRHPSDTVTVQFGHSAPPGVAIGVDFLAPPDLAGLMARSDVVITHGGPATISGARAAGHRPLVLARDPGRGEHVDDHQQRFTRWSARRGHASCVEGVADLDEQVALLVREDTGTHDIADEGSDGDDDTGQRLRRLLERYRAGGSGASVDAPVVLRGVGSQRNQASVRRGLAEVATDAVFCDIDQVWRAAVENPECSCGRRFAACPFWWQIGSTAFGGWNRVDLDRLADLQTALEKPVNRLWGMSPVEPLELRRNLAAYTGYCQSVYRAVRDISGAEVVVDLGADRLLTFVLSTNREIDLRVLWLGDRPSDRIRRHSNVRRSQTLRRRRVPQVWLPESLVDDLPTLERACADLQLPLGLDRTRQSGAVQAAHITDRQHSIAVVNAGVGTGS